MFPDDEIIKLAARVSALETMVSGLLGIADRSKVPAFIAQAKQELSGRNIDPILLAHINRELDSWAATAQAKAGTG